MMRKLIYKFFPALPSTLNIYRSYFFEARRFVRFNTNNRYREDQNKHRAMLIRKCHGLEKAFSLPKMKKSFGIPQTAALLEEVRIYFDFYGLEREVLDGLKILDSYFNYHLEVNDAKILLLNEQFRELLAHLNVESCSLIEDCFQPFSQQTEINGVQFEAFFSSRFSIRKFIDEIISIDKLIQCGYVAGKSPSACNRQPWNLRIIQSPKQIKKALSLQNGNRGFSEEIRNLAIVTGKISSFSSKERNQVFIDCGMYSMSFILALHANGIASCPLNMSYQSRDEIDVAKSLKFDEDEVPIMMIAFGIAAEDSKFANSERKQSKEYIHYNNVY